MPLMTDSVVSRSMQALHRVPAGCYTARPRAWAPRSRLPDVDRPLGSDRGREMRVALCIPIGGLSGIWGPSAMASAQLAAAELNQADGIGGRPCRLIAVNADDDSTLLEDQIEALLDDGEIDAIVGMHTSRVRQRMLRVVGGQVPYVYTPLYEGGESTPGVFAIGDTPLRQLYPAMRWLQRHERPRRWAMIGDDYVWPQRQNGLAHHYVRECGGEVVMERYMPTHADDYSAAIDALLRCRADAVLVSFVGDDTIAFNRAFGQAGLGRRMLRLTCATEENELLAIGADNTHRLYVAASYFAALQTDANLSFKARYLSTFGPRSPTLNALGQSTYEGLHFLAALVERGLAAPEQWGRRRAPLAYRSAREGLYGSEGVGLAPTYLAVAEGHVFRVLTQLTRRPAHGPCPGR